MTICEKFSPLTSLVPQIKLFRYRLKAILGPRPTASSSCPVEDVSELSLVSANKLVALHQQRRRSRCWWCSCSHLRQLHLWSHNSYGTRRQRFKVLTCLFWSQRWSTRVRRNIIIISFGCDDRWRSKASNAESAAILKRDFKFPASSKVLGWYLKVFIYISTCMTSKFPTNHMLDRLQQLFTLQRVVSMYYSNFRVTYFLATSNTQIGALWQGKSWYHQWLLIFSTFPTKWCISDTIRRYYVGGNAPAVSWGVMLIGLPLHALHVLLWSNIKQCDTFILRQCIPAQIAHRDHHMFQFITLRLYGLLKMGGVEACVSIGVLWPICHALPW